MNAKDGAWKIMASSKGGDDEQSQMFAIFCVHVYTRTRLCTHVHAWFQIKWAYVTRNKAKGSPKYLAELRGPKAYGESERLGLGKR